MRYPIYDLHGHFLPGVDDGCSTVEESLQVLESSYAQGVRLMCATPHYYPLEPVSAFLERRAAAAEKLFRRMEAERKPLPQIVLGAEVAYRQGIGYEEELDKLCIGASRYLLLEMPFERWSGEVVRSVRNMCLSKGIIPIIAHIERYISMQSRDVLMQIMEQDVLVQMNAEHLLRAATRRNGRRLLNDGVVQLLGTDCHNMTDRAPNLGAAVAYLEKKKMDYVLNEIAENSQMVMQAAIG